MEGKISCRVYYYNHDASNIRDLTTCLLYRLGHREQKDEWKPRLVEIFQKHNVLPPNAIVSAGSASSACTAGMIHQSVVDKLSYNAFWVINCQSSLLGFIVKEMKREEQF